MRNFPLAARLLISIAAFSPFVTTRGHALTTPLTGVIASRSSANHTVTLRSDGTVWTWGDNGNGQLGDGTTTNRTTNVQVSGLNNIVAIAGGSARAVALKSDGAVWVN